MPRVVWWVGAKYKVLITLPAHTHRIYFAYGIDPASVEYIYSTPPGSVLVVLRVLSFVWMSYAIQTTLRKYKAKKGFYKKLWFFGGLCQYCRSPLHPFCALTHTPLPARIYLLSVEILVRFS